jgi:hypothetical protein
MKTTIVCTLLSLLFVPLTASAEKYYFSGNETPMSGGQAKTGPFTKAGRPVSVLVEIDVTADKITQRVYMPKDASSIELSVFEIKKQGASWIHTSQQTKKTHPVTVEMTGGRLRKVNMSVELGALSRVFSIDMTDPILFKHEDAYIGKGGTFKSWTVVDAGIILPNQFQSSIKGRKTVPRDRPKPGQAGGAAKK